MPKYMLIMRGTDESNAAMMASIDEAMAETGRFIEAMIKAGVLLAAEGRTATISAAVTTAIPSPPRKPRR